MNDSFNISTGAPNRETKASTLYPLVTINIPTYNQEKYIAKAIRSAIDQDYPNLQINVSDDCSTDNTLKIAKTFEREQVKVFKTSTNAGRVANYRNMLYNLSKGEWVVNLDGDDCYNDPTFISEAVELLTMHPSCVMYVAGSSSLDEETGKIQKAPIYLKNVVTILKGTDYVLNFYKYGQIGQHFSVIYNRDIALQTNFYILDSLGADTDSICRLALKGNVIVHKKWIGVWTSHSRNASYTLHMTNVQKELNMLEHVASAARNYLPGKTVDRWLKESKQLKLKNSLYFSLPSFSLDEGLRLLMRNWSWRMQDFKELIKIFLR
jgi:glycosyltransferase involved in cell wall biosynthesis